MAKVVARVLPNPPQVMDIASQLLTTVPQCFLELGGRKIAEQASRALKKMGAEVGHLDDRLAAFPKCVEAAINTAALWNNVVSVALYEITDPLWGEQTLSQQIEALRIRLLRLRDAIPPEIKAATTSRGRRPAETQINEFVCALEIVWTELTGVQPDKPRPYGIDDKFVGDFLDFAWAAIELGRNFGDSKDLGLPNSKNALGERLARKKRTNTP